MVQTQGKAEELGAAEMSGDEPDDPSSDEQCGLDPATRREFELALAGDLETSLELQEALPKPPEPGHREPTHREPGAVEYIWRLIADGNANILEKDIWVTNLAKEVVEKVLTAKATDRPRAALKALGFAQRLDPHWRLRKDSEMLESFEHLDGGPPLSRLDMAKAMQRKGHLPKASEKSAKKVMARLRDKRPKQGEP